MQCNAAQAKVARNMAGNLIHDNTLATLFGRQYLRYLTYLSTFVSNGQ